MKTRTKAGVAGVAAVAVLATGGIAVAQSTGSSTAGHGHQGNGTHHSDIEHGQFVERDGKTGQQVTVDVVNGTVTTVSATSLTVKAGDGTSFTFAVSSATKVELRSATSAGPSTGASASPSASPSGSSTSNSGGGHHSRPRPTTATIGAIKAGQTVHVMGTGTGPYVATKILGD